MPSWLDRTISIMLTLAAITITGTLVHREFFAPSLSGRVPAKAEYVENWRTLLPAGHFVGDPRAPITIVEFSDLECPFCRQFHGALRTVVDKHPGQVTYSFIHFPLAGHKHALRAAHAAECAGYAGKFAAALDVMFSHQDSLAASDWSWLMRETRMRDTTTFARCMADTTTPPRVKEGLALGSKMKIAGTPTVLLNGWRYTGMPADTELVRAVDDLLAGRKPYKGFPATALTAPRPASSNE